MNDEKFDFEKFAKEAGTRVKGGQPILGKDGVLTPLIKMFLETVLEGEIDHHLAGEEGANRKNGKARKTMKSTHGSFELETPRDRAVTFEPEIIKKRQTSLPGDLDHRIITMYSYGTSCRDISSELQELLGLELSEGFISAVTDKVIPMLEEWRDRPLDAVYCFVWLDAIHYKVREEGKVILKAIYCILGINLEGKKELLGLYISENEGAKFWLQVLNQLRRRGVEDILVSCIDNLKGFAEAIEATFPKTEVQLCIVHQVRNALKYVHDKDRKEFIADMKKIYQALTKDAAEVYLAQLSEKWGKKYRVAIESWQNNWNRLSQFYKYSAAIRRVIYTTNPIEGFHRQLRKYTKSKSVFTNDKAILKLVYLIQERITKKWTKTMENWPEILNELSITFEGRLRMKV